MLIRVPAEQEATAYISTKRESFFYMPKACSKSGYDGVECHHLERRDRFWFESNRGHRCSTPPTNRQPLSGCIPQLHSDLGLLSASEAKSQGELLDSRDAKSSSIEAESEAAVIGPIVEGGIGICVEAD